MWIRSLGQENPLEAGVATPSRILAWRIPRTEETGGLQSMGSPRWIQPKWLGASTSTFTWYFSFLCATTLHSAWHTCAHSQTYYPNLWFFVWFYLSVTNRPWAFRAGTLSSLPLSPWSLWQCLVQSQWSIKIESYNWIILNYTLSWSQITTVGVKKYMLSHIGSTHTLFSRYLPESQWFLILSLPLGSVNGLALLRSSTILAFPGKC